MPLTYFKNALNQPAHGVWVIAQQILVRGLLALKFLLAARFLGPEQIGLVGIALLSLAIVESLSDTGLSQAIIQRQNTINSIEAGGVWTLLISRGLILSALLIILAIPISSFFSTQAVIPLLLIAAIIPVLRNSINPGLYLVIRACNFRKIAIYEVSASLIDFIVTMILIHKGYGAIALLFGNIASESLKLFVSWIWLRSSMIPNFKWKNLKSLTGFGKWIWGSSIITLVLNQLDKVLVTKFLGPTELGLYQVASRVAQLIITDGVVALGQYLYPVFSRLNRDNPDKIKKYFSRILRKLILVIIFVSVLLSFFAEDVIGLALGSKWLNAAPLLSFLVLPMSLGAVIAVLVPYLRAIGKPKYVTKAIMVQLICMLIFTPILLYYYGAIGMICGVAIAGSSAVYFMLRKLY